MAYQKQQFKNYTVLTAEQLNHIEDGIANVEKNANSRVKTINGVIPDESGNVQITIPESGSGGNGEPGDTGLGFIYYNGEGLDDLEDYIAFGDLGTPSGYTPQIGDLVLCADGWVFTIEGIVEDMGAVEVSSTGICLMGESGSPGKDIESINVPGDGTVEINRGDGDIDCYPFGSVYNVKTVNGIAPDENGNIEITIPDSGGNAEDGFSPIATVTQSTSGAVVSITDKTGTTTATITNGKDGKDGTSATHSWNGTVLTISSASGTSSVDLKGATGATGPKGTGIKSITITEVT